MQVFISYMSNLGPKRLCSISSLVIEVDRASTVSSVASLWKGKECGELPFKMHFFGQSITWPCLALRGQRSAILPCVRRETKNNFWFNTNDYQQTSSLSRLNACKSWIFSQSWVSDPLTRSSFFFHLHPVTSKLKLKGWGGKESSSLCTFCKAVWQCTNVLHLFTSFRPHCGLCILEQPFISF